VALSLTNHEHKKRNSRDGPCGVFYWEKSLLLRLQKAGDNRTIPSAYKKKTNFLSIARLWPLDYFDGVVKVAQDGI
jgi:hypothetical protein